MRYITLLLAIILVQIANGQIVSSSYTASDSVIAKYKDDADQLTLERIRRTHLTYIDSVNIPRALSDTILNALIAVYNATSLPYRDDVIKKWNIHTLKLGIINTAGVFADSTLTWMHQLKKGIIPTGNLTVDSLISKYHLSISKYDDGGYYKFFGKDNYVIFESDQNINTYALDNLFKKIPGVSHTDINSTVGDGNDIRDSVYADHVELIYSHGSGDCPAGCIYRTYWKYNAYYDCSVEFIETYTNGRSSPDINYDGVVNVTDFLFVLGKFNTHCANINNCPGDINGDGIVNVTDFLAVLGDFGSSL